MSVVQLSTEEMEYYKMKWGVLWEDALIYHRLRRANRRRKIEKIYDQK